MLYYNYQTDNVIDIMHPSNYRQVDLVPRKPPHKESVFITYSVIQSPHISRVFYTELDLVTLSFITDYLGKQIDLYTLTMVGRYIMALPLVLSTVIFSAQHTVEI